MSTNNGFINENEFIEYINSNSFQYYNANIKKFILHISGNSNPTEVIAKQIAGTNKPDLQISIDSLIYYVSMKMGSGNSVHQESLTTFIDFLRDNGISEKAITLLKEYHYADGTDNDTGQIRLSARDFSKHNPEKIKCLNTLFNNNSSFTKTLLNRVLFQGVDSSAPIIDFLYHGTLESGVWASVDELNDFKIQIKGSNFCMKFLSYQVWGRNQDFNAKYPERRHVVQFKFSQCENILNKIRGELNE